MRAHGGHRLSEGDVDGHPGPGQREAERDRADELPFDGAAVDAETGCEFEEGPEATEVVHPQVGDHRRIGIETPGIDGDRPVGTHLDPVDTDHRLRHQRLGSRTSRQSGNDR